MALQKILSTSPSGPYHRNPPVKIHVLLQEEQPRVLSWTFTEDSAVPALTKKNKVAVITDGESISKITLFEELASKISAGRNYMMRGYSLRGQSPPYHILVHKSTNFYVSSPVVCRDGLMEEARALLYPPSQHTTISAIGGVSGLFTLEGKIMEFSAVKRVHCGREEVPLREIKLGEGATSVLISLWREAAIADLQKGSHCRITHLRVGEAVRRSIQSTMYTKVEMQSMVEVIEGVEVQGALPSSQNGVVELMLGNGNLCHVKEELWTPFHQLLLEGVLIVNLKIENTNVVQITPAKKSKEE